MIRYLVVGILGIAIGAIGARTFGGPSHELAPTTATRDDSAAAVPGIAALHRADSVATISGVPTELRELWDSAAVRIVPGGPATVTRAAIYAQDSTYRASHPATRIVQYAPRLLGLSVNGNSAVEWGYSDAQFVAAPGAAPESGRINVLRVLRRQTNGEWKFTHVIFNSAR
jgi:hypothetical protein